MINYRALYRDLRIKEFTAGLDKQSYKANLYNFLGNLIYLATVGDCRLDGVFFTQEKEKGRSITSVEFPHTLARKMETSPHRFICSDTLIFFMAMYVMTKDEEGETMYLAHNTHDGTVTILIPDLDRLIKAVDIMGY